ncbi:MAG: TonB-dependent receptor [Prevotellaceae bacterium]|nr:TonB-dependent receptor [Prevotellaceae bacterium]
MGFVAVYPLGALARGGDASVQAVQQQKQSVSGTVQDSSGDPVIGASILEKGTNNGTITDVNGHFTLNVTAGATLVISYIGYKTQEVTATAGRSLSVTLADDSEALEEVVVVGYGVQKKSDVTGSVTSVNKNRLEKLPVTNVLQAVQGAVAGVTIMQTSSIPGEAPSTIVRGQNSINADSGPYVVVDGIPINKTGGSLNDIAPSDIESIEILKDASATAIYGTNGSNGVILITTKHGKSGKPVIKYSGYVGIEDFAHKLPFGDGANQIQRYKDYCDQNPGETLQFGNGNLMYANEEDAFNSGTETDWVYGLASRTGLINDHNLSIAGGADKASYYVSLDYMGQKGIIQGYNYKRYSIRTNLDVDVTDWLKVGTNTYIASHNRDGGRASLLNAEAMSPYGKVYDDDGSYTIYPMYKESLWANPMIGTTEDVERRVWNISLNGYAEVDFGKMWHPLEGLKYKLNAGYSYAPTRNSSYSGAADNDENGTGKIVNSETQTRTIENIVTYARDIQKHHFDVTLLYASTRKKYSSATAKGQKFINDDLSFNGLGTAETASVDADASLYTTASQMGRINYSYDSRYLFTFTVRRDGSSVFGANHKYGTFPSVALGWNIAREAFMEPTNNWLNDLKLRLSYGKSGNEAIDVYESMTKLSSAKISMGGSTAVGLYPNSRMGNEDLSWETSKTFNFGLDFGFFDNRLSGNLDVYTTTTTGLLLKRNLPDLSGFSDVYANMGKTANKGVELTVNSKNIVTKDFTWSTNIVFSWNKNQIKDLYGDKQDDTGNKWFIGKPIGVIYDYDMVGIWQEDEIEAGEHLNWDPVAEAGDVKLADRNGDGMISDDDRYVKGQTTPKWIGGMTNTFSYKGLSLSVFVQTVQGIMKSNTLLSTASDEMGRRNMTTDVGYWTPENRSNKWRSLTKTSNSKHSYGYGSDASYTRIKDITLSYTFPDKLMQKAHLGGLTVYASGRNLFTFTNWIGWDPEASEAGRGSSNDGYSWEDNYPMTRSYVFGINLTF